MSKFERLACRASDWFASPSALCAIPLICAAWIVVGLSVDTLTLGLSILALTLTQLVLVGQGNGERAMQHKLDELVVAVPDADSGVAGEEKT